LSFAILGYPIKIKKISAIGASSPATCLRQKWYYQHLNSFNTGNDSPHIVQGDFELLLPTVKIPQ
jgi:hypothetical protein